MAGVGFELRKLYGKKSFLENITANFYSTIVVIGPMLICMAILLIFRIILNVRGVSSVNMDLFTSTISYSFIFSFIITGGFVFLISRYISDQIFNKKENGILPSFYGITLTVATISSIIGVVFYSYSPLGFIYKIVAYSLFIILSILWIQMTYLSAVKNYMGIIKGYLLGVIVIVISNVVFYKLLGLFSLEYNLASVLLGFFTIVIYFAIFIKSYFYKSEGKIFDFISYFDKYKLVFLTGAFLSLGVFIHNIIIWFGSYGLEISNTYFHSSLYDIPVFYSVLTIIPTMVFFVISVETSFYEKYRNFYLTILNGGNIKEIELAKKEMQDALMKKLFLICELQVFIGFIAVILGLRFLPQIGLTRAALDIYVMLVLGQACYIIMFINVLILLYFDDAKGAVKTSGIFAGLSIVLTYLTYFLGTEFLGTGFFVASAVSLVISFNRLLVYLKNLEYYTFASQPVIVEDSIGIFNKISKKIDI